MGDNRIDDEAPGELGLPARRPNPWPWFMALLVSTAALVMVGLWFRYREAPPAPIGPGIAEAPPLPPPEDSPAFQAVRDREPIRFSENAAYAELLERVRETPLDQLKESARRDIYFSDLLRNPERYRGLPIHLQGVARRILRLEDVPKSLSPDGELFEAWTFTSDSRGYPYVLVFEDPPEGLPGGDDVQAFVIFHGYFFKLLAYAAADKARVAPLLVGRIEYEPRMSGDAAAAPAAPVGPTSSLWMVLPIALLVLYLLYRTATTVRTAFGASPATQHVSRPHRDSISPEELSDWLHRGPEPHEDTSSS